MNKIERIIINGQEITPIDIDSLECEYESPYLQSIMTVNKEKFNILILKEDKERWIKAFNGTKEQTNEK